MCISTKAAVAMHLVNAQSPLVPCSVRVRGGSDGAVGAAPSTPDPAMTTAVVDSANHPSNRDAKSCSGSPRHNDVGEGRGQACDGFIGRLIRNAAACLDGCLASISKHLPPYSLSRTSPSSPISHSPSLSPLTSPPNPLPPPSPPSPLTPVSAHSARPGLPVRRGADWKWGGQDRGIVGVLEGPHVRHGWWCVKWRDGTSNVYRVGAGGRYDLVYHFQDPDMPEVSRGVDVYELLLYVRDGQCGSGGVRVERHSGSEQGATTSLHLLLMVMVASLVIMVHTIYHTRIVTPVSHSPGFRPVPSLLRVAPCLPPAALPPIGLLPAVLPRAGVPGAALPRVQQAVSVGVGGCVWRMSSLTVSLTLLIVLLTRLVSHH